jgi:hypothetical protein
MTTARMTEERAARRFYQIRQLTEHLRQVEAHIGGAKEEIADLKKQRDGVLAQLLAASRDEGALPLFDDLEP